MQKFTALLLPIFVFILMTTMAPFISEAQTTQPKQTVSKMGEGASTQGPSTFFTGKASVQSISPEVAPSRNAVAYVTFQPGARSNWHNHPAGQTLIVVLGVAWTQEWNANAYIAGVGDVIYCPPNVKHWHGASPEGAMTHVSIVENVNGKNVNWLESVTDEQYKTAGKQIKGKLK